EREAELGRDPGRDRFEGGRPRSLLTRDFERPPCRRDRELPRGERGELARPIEGALERTNASLFRGSKKLEDVLGELDRGLLCPVEQDRAAKREIRRVNLGRDQRFETVRETVCKRRNLGRRQVADQNELSSSAEQSGEAGEELIKHSRVASQELHVVE